VSPSSADPAPGGRPTLRVQVDPRAGRVAVVGRLGRRTAHLVHDAITVAAERPHPAAGRRLRPDRRPDRAAVLGGAYRRLLRGGRQMFLLGASPQLRRALRRLRLAEHVLDTSDDPPP
jgi:hypothetical protein